MRSLPEAPETFNTWDKLEQNLAEAMNGQNMVAMYQPLLQIIYSAIKSAAASWGEIPAPLPTMKDLEDFFFFLLSRPAIVLFSNPTPNSNPKTLNHHPIV